MVMFSFWCAFENRSLCLFILKETTIILRINNPENNLKSKTRGKKKIPINTGNALVTCYY